MYSGVPTNAPKPVNSVLSVSRCPVALATPKSITFTTGLPSYGATSTLRRLEVAVDDPLLVGVLHRPADVAEQLQPFPHSEPVLVAVVRDRLALDQLHHEVRAGPTASFRHRGPWRCSGWSIRASACRSASKRARTCLESMPSLTTLTATRRWIGSVCSAIQTVPMPPSPICSSSLYGPMTVPAAFAGRQVGGDRHVFGQVEQVAGPFVGAQQGLDLGAQGRVVAAGPVQERRTLGG